MPQTVTVSTLAGLNAALATAKGGETILLKAGDYGGFKLALKDFPSNVTVTSVDPGDPAVFSGLILNKVSNLTFDGVVFDYTYQAGDATNFRPFRVDKSHDLAIRNSTFDGDLAWGKSATADGYGTGYGLTVMGSANIVVENNEFYNFSRGAIFGGVEGLTISGNDLHSISSDGMNFAEVQKVLIEGNFLHEFLRSPNSTDHPDMIQFWTSDTKTPSGDIIIRGNRLDVGDGSWTQSLFMRNELVDSLGAGKGMYYYNILIEDNIIANGHTHGITVGETNGLVIRNNTLVHAAGDDTGIVTGVNLPAIQLARKSTHVTVTDNIATGLNGHDGQAGWTVKGNLLLAPKDYNDAFVTSTTYSNNGIHEFRARPGGVIDAAGVGATETRDTYPAALTAQFDATRVDQSLSTWVFDATASAAGKADFPAGTLFLWDFGDGTTGPGRIVEHSYVNDGHHDATLTIQLPDGRMDGARQLVAAETADVLKMGHGVGFTIYDPGVTSTLAVAAVTKQGLTIGTPGTTVSVNERHVAELVGSANFGVDLSLKAASLSSTGEVFRVHGSIVASVTSKGEFELQAFTTDGMVKLVTTGAGLSDKALHDIRIEGGDDQISITVDGKMLASTELPAPLAGGGQNLTFGNPWGKGNFAGVITDFAIDNGRLALPDESKTVVLDATWAGKGVTQAPPEVVGPDANTPDPVPPTDAGGADGPPAPQPGQLDLGDSGVAHNIARADIAGMLRNDAFLMTLGLQTDSAASKGEVFRIHQSIITTVDAAGEFRVQAFTTQGEVKLNTKGARLDDLGQHEVGLSLADGVLSITVDGVVKASTAMKGTLLSEGRHNLTFGNPWGKENFDGVLTNFEVQFPTVDGSGRTVQTSVDLRGNTEGVSGGVSLGAAMLESVSENPAAAISTPVETGAAGALFATHEAGDGGLPAYPFAGFHPATMADVDDLIAMDRFGFLADPDTLVPYS